MAGERAAFLFLIIYQFIIFFLIKKFLLYRIIIFCSTIIFLVFFISSSEKVYERYIESTLQSTGFKSEKKFIFSEQHDSVFRTAWKMFIDKPVVGHGPKMYRVKCKDPKFATGITPCHNHPHNFYMQLLAETGLVGFLSIFYIFIHLSFLFFKHTYSLIFFKKRIFLDYKICLMSGVFITLWPITTNGNFFTNNLMIYYGLQMGFFFANKEGSQTQN